MFPTIMPRKRMAKKRVTKKNAAKNQTAPSKHVNPAVNGDLRTYTIRDYRLEKPAFTMRQVRAGGEIRYEVESADLSMQAAPAPPIRESKYLSPEQCIEIYR